MLEQHSDSEAMEVAEPAQTGVLIDISPGGEDRDGGVTRRHPEPPADTRHSQEGVARSAQTCSAVLGSSGEEGLVLANPVVDLTDTQQSVRSDSNNDGFPQESQELF